MRRAFLFSMMKRDDDSHRAASSRSALVHFRTHAQVLLSCFNKELTLRLDPVRERVARKSEL